MSLLVPELEQVIDRILVVTPDTQLLKELFETLSFELISGPGAGQTIDLAAAALNEGSIQYWTSFTLGKRAGSAMRLSLMGLSIENLVKNPSLLENSEALMVWIPKDAQGFERLLALKVPPQARAHPIIVAGVALENPHDKPSYELSFERKALMEWLRRNFDHVRQLPTEQKFLHEGLEWALSF